MTMTLDREEYIEQAYFFETLHDRLETGMSSQELLKHIQSELLATSRLPMAIDFMLAEMRLTGKMAGAMKRLAHYFTAFQTFVIEEAENEEGRFDFRIALQVLQREAKYRAEDAPVQGIFFYQFEAICRNRLGYDGGLRAIARDPIYDQGWRDWLDTLRRQIGLVDFSDMIYVRSADYRKRPGEEEVPVLFGAREGRIAHATRRRDPLYLFSALSRQLGYPSVPRLKKASDEENLLPVLQRRIEHLENRLKLLEEEQRGGTIELERFFKKENEESDG
jgi:hypothetical protein